MSHTAIPGKATSDLREWNHLDSCVEQRRGGPMWDEGAVRQESFVVFLP